MGRRGTGGGVSLPPLPFSPDRDLLTAEGLAALTGLNASTLKQRAQRGACRAWKKGKTWLFWRGDWEPSTNGKS